MMSLLLMGILIGRMYAPACPAPKVLGVFEDVSLGETGQVFHALVDTGAAFSSIHATGINVQGKAPDPDANIGKTVEYVIIDDKEQKAPMRSRIEKVRLIGNAEHREWRYHVLLTIVHRGMRHKVLVNLNDRSMAPEKFLLGRNFIQSGTLVDANRNTE
jgi:hypothetical protein